MNEIVPHPINVCVDHERINEPEDQHHPQRRARVKEEEAYKICEMKKARRGRNRVPARVREELRVRRRTFYSDGVGGHRSGLIFVEIRKIGKAS